MNAESIREKFSGETLVIPMNDKNGNLQDVTRNDTALVDGYKNRCVQGYDENTKRTYPLDFGAI